ncbi:hypothetical protein ACLB0R_03245 [Sphingomonas sp. GlSt437]|uniref:hypothetical protein n=1 Tax=Sphingomonas sp. GlSt437 TaxID=3389970 RepID=UPI003A863882
MNTTEVPAHSGLVRERTHPELYDVVTFAFAVLAVIFVRRALRARFARKRDEATRD